MNMPHHVYILFALQNFCYRFIITSKMRMHYMRLNLRKNILQFIHSLAIRLIGNIYWKIFFKIFQPISLIILLGKDK